MRNLPGPRSSLILATAGSLFLAACQSDVPTSANTGGEVGPPESFSLIPGAAEAAKGSSHQSPHGAIDATASTLSHEFFETITDPDGRSWFNLLTGFEVGDLCSPFGYNERLNRHSYMIQSEYSNAIHNCTDRS